MAILIVDDNEKDRYLLRRSLYTAGYGVRSGAGGEEALRLLQDSYFEAVITDLQMPGMDGLQLAREVHRVAPKTSIILCTGDSTPDLAERARQSGVLTVLAKPVNLPNLLKILAQVTQKAEPQTRGSFTSGEKWTCPRCGTGYMGWCPLNICSKCGYRDGVETN